MASARDIIWIAVFLFASALILFVINFSGYQISTNLANHSQINGTVAEAPIENITTSVDRVDFIIFLVFIGLILAMIVASWFVAGHPMFMFIYFLVITMAIILAMILSNAWGSVSQASVFGSTVARFPITNHILGILPLYTAIVGFIGITIMFAKPFMSDME